MYKTDHLDQLAADCVHGIVSFEEVAAAMRKRIKAIAWQAARAYQRFKPVYEVEDYENRVLFALALAIRNWDPARAAFATFFNRVAAYELNAIRKEMTALARRGNLDACSVEAQLEAGLHDWLAAAEDGFSRREFWTVFDALPLTPKQRLICLLVMQGYKNKEIALRLSITEAAVSLTLKRLRAKFGDAGLSIA